MRGDCQRAFATAAAGDGVALSPQSFPWLCQRGHLALPADASDAVAALAAIYEALGGDVDALASAPLTRLRGDFYHAPTRRLLELDESQHFTSARLLTLDLYPPDAALGFDVAAYKALIAAWHREADGYFRSKSARGFTAHGRQNQRAYYDALRDLATPAMGHPPLIRVAAPNRDGATAWASISEAFVD